jgi:hypothetical protein
MTNPRLFAFLLILMVLVGYAIGRYAQPAKVVTKTQVVTQVHDVVHEKIHKVIVTVTAPNGTKTTTTTIDNGSVINDQSNTQSNSSTVTTYDKTQWSVGALANVDLTKGISAPSYGIQVERRILGPVWVGAYGLANASGGLSVSLEF